MKNPLGKSLFAFLLMAGAVLWVPCLNAQTAPAPAWEAPQPADADANAYLPDVAIVPDVPPPTEQTATPAEPDTTSYDAEEMDKLNQVRSAMETAPAATPNAQGAPPAGETAPHYGVREPILQAIAGLCVVVALILIVYVILRKLGKRNPLLGGGEHASLIGRLYLDRSTRLHLVRIADRVLVVGTSGNAVSLLTEFDAAAFGGRVEAEGPKGVDGLQTDTFFAQLQGNLARMNQAETPQPEDVDIDAIRGEILRLKQCLEDDPSDHGE